MKYRKGVKYYLYEDDSVQTGILGVTIDAYYGSLSPEGVLTARRVYAWDGCSGPTWDDVTNMRSGLFHDLLSQFGREGLLDHDKWQSEIHLTLFNVYKQSIDRWLDEWHPNLIVPVKWSLRVVLNARAWIYYQAVMAFGKASTEPENVRKVYDAP